MTTELFDNFAHAVNDFRQLEEKDREGHLDELFNHLNKMLSEGNQHSASPVHLFGRELFQLVIENDGKNSICYELIKEKYVFDFIAS